MNIAMIKKIIGHIMRIEGALLLLPCIVALAYREQVGFIYLAVAGVTAIVGSLLALTKTPDTTIYLKDGCVATSLSWIVLSLIGAIPFAAAGEIPSYVDALFETISGFTTTGSSILSDVESLSHAALFWRDFTHWVGGMGVLVFLMSIVSLSGGSTINLMKAESPGPSVGKMTPKIKSTARMLYFIYTGLTVLMMIFLLIGGCNLFDSVTIACGTAGTGGFGTRNDSLVSFSPYVQWVVIIFMTLFGVNFNAFYFLVMRKFKEAFGIEEVKWYFIVIISSTVIIFANVRGLFVTTGEAVRHSAFQVLSVMTTSGFATADFDTWNTTAKLVLVVLMFIGACAGSTGGGIKVSRFIVMFRTMRKEVGAYLYPKSVKKIMFEGKPAEHEMIRSINTYMVTYIMIFVVSLFLLSFQGEDMTTTFTSVTTCINNIGPGLNKVGPTCNFGFMSNFSKFVLMFDMLAGRLELFPILILLHPKMIKELVSGSIKHR